MCAFVQGQQVFVDGKPGYISRVYSKGRGNYRGKRHAYYWVKTVWRIDEQGNEYVNGGMSVSFKDQHKRLKPRS